MGVISFCVTPLLSCQEEELDCYFVNSYPLRSHPPTILGHSSFISPNLVWGSVRCARGQSSPHAQSIGILKALANSCHPSYVFSPQSEALECFPEIPKDTWDAQTRTGMGREHSSLYLGLAQFLIRSTREERSLSLVSLGVSQPAPKDRLPLVQRVSQLRFPFCDSPCVVKASGE